MYHVLSNVTPFKRKRKIDWLENTHHLPIELISKLNKTDLASH